MFFTYLGRELRRWMRQVVFISLGLAVGVGLVITVTAASAGVAQAQGRVLHSLYGVGTDITVTKAPTANSGGPFGFRIRGGSGSGQRPTRPAAGTKFNRSTLINRALGPLSSSSVASISGLHGVAAAAGALTLTNLSISGTIPAAPSGGGFGGGGGGSGGGGGGPSTFKTSTFTVNGTQLSVGEVGLLSSGKITSGRTFTGSDSAANMAVVD
jgi:putative ABC transport system permease protein